jgi:apolipoprotein N-acyltransferase
VQAAPTGFSAFVTPEGTVLDRTAISDQAVRTRTVERREGDTWYQRLGDKPVVAVALLTVVLAVLLARRDRPSHLEPDGDGTVIDELDGHLGAEPARGHLGAEGP